MINRLEMVGKGERLLQLLYGMEVKGGRDLSQGCSFGFRNEWRVCEKMEMGGEGILGREGVEPKFGGQNAVLCSDS